MILLAATLFFLPQFQVTHDDRATSIAGDANGNSYVVSAPFETIEATYLTKLDSDGHIVYRVAIGNYGRIDPKPDSHGNVYFAIYGFTEGTNTPQSYAVKLDPLGRIVYKLPLPVYVSAPAVGLDGAAYFTGAARPSGGFSTTPGAWVSASQAAKDQTNAFVIKVAPAGDRIVYATFLNNAAPSTPSPAEPARGSSGGWIAVDSLGFAYVLGVTNDPAYPVTKGAFQTQCPNCRLTNYFVSKLSPDGNSLSYSTYLGNVGERHYDTPIETALTPAGSFQVVTTTYCNSCRPLEITTRARGLNADGTGLLFERTFAGSNFRVVPDGRGNLLVSGVGLKLDLPPTEGALQNGPATVALVRPTDAFTLFSTRLALGQRVTPDGTGGFLAQTSSGSYGQAWTLTRYVPDSSGRPSIMGVINSALPPGKASRAIVPRELVNIQGVNIGPVQPITAKYDSQGHLPYYLGGTQVLINGIPAPLLSVANQQVVAQVPVGVAGAIRAKVTLSRNGETSNPAEFPVRAVEPYMFEGPADSEGYRYALAVNQDGTLNSESNPARADSIVAFFINGAGVFTPTMEDGAQGRVEQKLAATISVRAAVGWGGTRTPPEILYAGAAPSLTGVTQLNLRIPSPPYNRPVRGPYGEFFIKIGDADIYSLIWVTP